MKKALMLLCGVLLFAGPALSWGQDTSKNIDSVIKQAVKEELSKKDHSDDHAHGLLGAIKDEDEEIGGFLGIFAIFGALIFPPLVILAAVGLILYFWYKRRTALYATLKTLAEKGVPISPDQLLPHKKEKNDLRKGIILLSVGAGIIVSVLLIGNKISGAWPIGLIPLIIGVGYIVVWVIDKKKHTSPADNKIVE